MNKRFFLASLAGIIIVLTLFAGCSQPAKQTDSGGDKPAQDRAGLEISVPDEINGIITMAPAITQVLVDLGLEDKIIAMDTQSAGLLGVDSDMPAFDMLSPDAESLAVLNPSIILASGISMMDNEANDPFQSLKKLGICVAYIPTSESIAEIKDDLRFIAAVVGEPEKGETLISKMESDMKAVEELRGNTETGKKVYFEIAAAPAMYSFGKGVFLNEMIELVGMENIFADKDSWLSVEAESVVAANPDIIFTNVNYIDDPVGEILSRPGWEEINAVKNKQVYYIDNNNTSLPNHNIVKGMEEMAMYLYGGK